ncbi:MAG TPA: BON domain-containing protein [Chthonomonadaceae bacterium]|nr:BON domain-containing protein [Chthonomonadaceae bacterium]
MNSRYSPILAPAALLMAGLLMGCSTQDSQKIEQDTQSLAHDTGKAVGGVGIQAKVVTALSTHKGVDMSGLHIDTNSDGVVTLGGHVRSEEEKQTVVETAKGVSGVTKVVDNLRVQPGTS